jgi:hypothetical protein
MTVVFASFVANPSPLVKMLGVGLSTAIVLDATIVRMVLVPATMTLLGRANWWLPRWLDRRLPRLVAQDGRGDPADAVRVGDGVDLDDPSLGDGEPQNGEGPSVDGDDHAGRPVHQRGVQLGIR